MPVRTPEEMHPAFQAAFNAQDLDGLLALYEEGAVLTPEPGAVVTGHAGIREALGGFLSLNLPIRMTTKTIIPAGDLVMLHGAWSITGSGPDGSPIDLSARSSEVVRRQADGTWLYIIDNPYSVDAS